MRWRCRRWSRRPTPLCSRLVAVVATLAALAVGARRTGGRLAAALPGVEGRLARLGDGVALAGGLLLLAVGLVLFQAAWTTPIHPLR